MDINPQQYKDGKPTSLGDNVYTTALDRKILLENRPRMVFSKLNSIASLSLPKNMGKDLTVTTFLPILDDRNISDQGIDATGAVDTTPGSGNLYGSSRDVATILKKMPMSREEGGRINRVGNTKINRKGTLSKFSFFTEYTEDELAFDNIKDLQTRIRRNLIEAAIEIVETQLAIDLMTMATHVYYTGEASDMAELSGNAGVDRSLLTYDTLTELRENLQKDRVPPHTKMLTGSQNTATTTVLGGWVLYIGIELQTLVENMEDANGNRVFRDVSTYASQTQTLEGEIGKISNFRFVVAPELPHREGEGAEADESGALTYRTIEKEGKKLYNAYPIILVGEEAFGCISFMHDGKGGNFAVKDMPIGVPSRDDPTGEVGLTSIKWNYGSILMKPQNLSVIWSLALN